MKILQLYARSEFPPAAAAFSFFMPQKSNPPDICWVSIKFCSRYAVVNGINFITTFSVPIRIIICRMRVCYGAKFKRKWAFTTVSNSYYVQFDVRLYRAFLHSNSCHFINIPISSVLRSIWDSTDASRNINTLVVQPAARPLRINYMYILWVHKYSTQIDISFAWIVSVPREHSRIGSRAEIIFNKKNVFNEYWLA